MTALVTAVVPLLASAALLMLALQRGELGPATMIGGVLCGSLAALAWALRRERPRLAAILWGGAAVPAALLVVISPRAGAGTLTIAAALLAVWSWHVPRTHGTVGA
jgi:hypothetical protein